MLVGVHAHVQLIFLCVHIAHLCYHCQKQESLVDALNIISIACVPIQNNSTIPRLMLPETARKLITVIVHKQIEHNCNNRPCTMHMNSNT